MLVVCDHCLSAIMSREQIRYTRYCPEDDGNEEETRHCDWCEDEFDNDMLYIIL